MALIRKSLVQNGLMEAGYLALSCFIMPTLIICSENTMDQQPAKPSFLQAVISTLWAFLGISKNARRERDFQHGDPKVFIFVGILLTVIFVLSVYTVVQLVLP